MKKILYFVAALAAASIITTMGTSCKFAPDQHDGDTVAASEFYPIDTSAAHAKKMAKIAAIKNGKDSVGIYYVGSNSTKDLIELDEVFGRVAAHIIDAYTVFSVLDGSNLRHLLGMSRRGIYRVKLAGSYRVAVMLVGCKLAAGTHRSDNGCSSQGCHKV